MDNRQRRLSLLVIAAVLLASVGAILLARGAAWFLNEQVNIRCSRNLGEIARALSIYCKENGGAYPDSLQVLVKLELLYPDDLSPDQQTLPYHYLKPPREGIVVGNPIVLREPWENHGGRGGHVLYADGTKGWEAREKRP
jgi:prepilin-type processing-associated H-X9-DG protein